MAGSLFLKVRCRSVRPPLLGGQKAAFGFLLTLGKMVALIEWCTHMVTPLTEAQWFSFADCVRMLNHLKRSFHTGRTQSGKRKLRLFACGSCRALVWDQKMSNHFRQRVETAEKVADGQLSSVHLTDDSNMEGVTMPKPDYGPAWYAALAMQHTLLKSATNAARWTARHLVTALTTDNSREVKKRLADLLRDVFGNPHREVSVDPGWLAWKDGTIVKIAQTIYDERRFENLPVLADALEEAGCVDESILRHCREPREHLRGCWVVDLILEKT
jgi:hypothetical protein